MDGILIIDKPVGLTSHDVCQQIKRVLRCRRVGHTGTLDPLATGVLPILLNGATKWAERFANDDKEYVVSAAFGVATTTYDAEGDVAAECPVPADLAARVEGVLPQFRGVIQQIPPPFSAVKFQGKPLYWWARKGRVVEVPARQVEIKDFKFVDSGSWLVVRKPAESTLDSNESRITNHESLHFRITCSKGTYVRSLIHDLGQAIGCGAHVTALRRLRSGPFSIEEAHPLAQICRPISDEDFHKFLYKKTECMLG